MEFVLSAEEYRKFDQEIKEVIYGCFARGEIILFPKAKAKKVAKLACNFIINKFITNELKKQTAYHTLIGPITQLVRKELHPGDWLLAQKPPLISKVYERITEYLKAGKIIKIYYPPPG